MLSKTNYVFEGGFSAENDDNNDVLFFKVSTSASMKFVALPVVGESLMKPPLFILPIRNEK